MLQSLAPYASHLPSFCQPHAPNTLSHAENGGIKQTGVPKSFKERFCANWRVIPALLSLAACITGLVLSIVWGYQYLSVAFGVGIAGALYMLYLAYQSRLWQSLETSSKKFIQENQVYAQENIKLKAEVSSLNKTSQDLSETKMQLSGEVSTLSKTVTSLSEEKEQLSKIAQECNEAVQFQQRLKEELKKLESGLQAEHSNISETFETISEEVKTLAQHNATTSSINEDLQRTGESLSQIFSQVSQMVNNEQVQRQIEQQRGMSELLETTNNQLQAKIKELTQIESQITSLKQHAEELKLQNEKLAQTNEKLGAQVDQFTTQNLTLTGSIESIKSLTRSLDPSQLAELQKEKDRLKKEEEDKSKKQ